MIYVANESNNPFYNHALEEYVMKCKKDDAFILWRNRPSILIGRNQNTLTEIDVDYVKKENIDVVRRLSGGGTVFNDLGNINFTFITKKANDGGSLGAGFEKFALPVIEALVSLGVEAVFTGRNDITIDGKKFSGNAQYYHKDKILHHGTLLYSGNLERLAKALKTKPLKFQDKGVKSVRSRVTNISEHLEKSMDVVDFKEYLKKFIMEYHGITKEYSLTEEENDQVLKIQRERFESFQWNYGKKPGFNFTSQEKFSGGTVEIYMKVNNGIIEDVKIYGDFFGERPVGELEKVLVGKKQNYHEILNVLKENYTEKYIKGTEAEELANLLAGKEVSI